MDVECAKLVRLPLLGMPGSSSAQLGSMCPHECSEALRSTRQHCVWNLHDRTLRFKFPDEGSSIAQSSVPHREGSDKRGDRPNCGGCGGDRTSPCTVRNKSLTLSRYFVHNTQPGPGSEQDGMRTALRRSIHDKFFDTCES